MSKISDAFKNGKAFIPFITVGDPDIATTKATVLEMVKAGVNMIEFGIPFSDPTAEGPVIQEANVRALANGITTDDVFEFVADIRKEVDIPLVFMTYANVVYSYDSDKFLAKCQKVGINGLILPDVPYEEKEEFDEVASKYDVELISLIAPTSENRIAMIAKEAKGFIYLVSSLGVTGTRSEITTDIGSIVESIRKVTDVPVAVGFGISTPQQAHDMAALSDGAIVGSAIIKILAKEKQAAPKAVGEYVKSMVDAL